MRRALFASVALLGCGSSGSGGGGVPCGDAGACPASGGSGGASGGSASGGTAGGAVGGSAAACQPTLDECYVAGPAGPGNECLAKADFQSSAVTQLRVSSHQVTNPSALAQPFVQDSILSKKSALYEPQCNIDGLGQLNMLLAIDTAQNSVTLGGGVPQSLIGPAKEGTCFASFTASGIPVQPTTVPYADGPDGQLVADFPFFALPIFLTDTGDEYMTLPLHDLKLTAKLSPDKNCIGSYAAETLSRDFSCQPNQGSFAWEAGGRYEGYVTVAEADQVPIESLGQTLCVLLSGDPATWKGPNGDCASTGGGLPTGDWCSTTNSAGGCQDSFRLVIEIAAQAIAIKGTYDPASGNCSG